METAEQLDTLAQALRGVPGVQANQIAETVRELVDGQIHQWVNDHIRQLIDNDIRKLVEDGVEKQVRPFLEAHFQEIGLTQEILAIAQLLAGKSNNSKEQVFLKALTLYGLALDANEKGNRLVIINSDDEIIHDVIGFDTLPKVVGAIAS